MDRVKQFRVYNTIMVVMLLVNLALDAFFIRSYGWLEASPSSAGRNVIWVYLILTVFWYQFVRDRYILGSAFLLLTMAFMTIGMRYSTPGMDLIVDLAALVVTLRLIKLVPRQINSAL